MTQNERVAQYMREFGSITSYEAFRDLGISRLASRIHDLTESGLQIERENVKVKNRFGETTTVTRYWIKGEK